MPHVLIIGGGFAGLNAAKRLGGVPGIDVTLVDRTNHHLFPPLLDHVSIPGLSPAYIADPIRSLLSRYSNIWGLQRQIQSLCLSRTVAVADLGAFAFVYLIMACG